MIPLAPWQIIPTIFGVFALALLFFACYMHYQEQGRHKPAAVALILGSLTTALTIMIVLTDPISLPIG